MTISKRCATTSKLSFANWLRARSLAAFLEEAERVDPDGISVELARLGRELEDLQSERNANNQVIGAEQNELKRMDGSSQAAETTQETEDLRTKVRLEVEQYARLRLASAVLREGIERYRKKAQGPVLDGLLASFPHSHWDRSASFGWSSTRATSRCSREYGPAESHLSGSNR